MPDRQQFSTGNPWEKSVGFSRAVRAGNLVFTAGTVAVDESGQIQGETCYEQCCYIFEKLAKVLGQAGCSLAEVVKVVCYLRKLEDADGFTRAHSEYLGLVRPATTCVQVAGLFGEESLVEIELTAVVRD